MGKRASGGSGSAAKRPPAPNSNALPQFAQQIVQGQIDVLAMNPCEWASQQLRQHPEAIKEWFESLGVVAAGGDCVWPSDTSPVSESGMEA